MNVTPVTPDDVDRYLRRLGVAAGSAVPRAAGGHPPGPGRADPVREDVDPPRRGAGPSTPVRRCCASSTGSAAATASTSTAPWAPCCARPRLRRHDPRRPRPGGAPTGRRAPPATTPPSSCRGVDDATRLVDAGLGDGLHEPLPLQPGRYRQGPYTFTIAHDDDDDVWHLRHDPPGRSPGSRSGPRPWTRHGGVRLPPRPPLDLARLRLRPRRHACSVATPAAPTSCARACGSS